MEMKMEKKDYYTLSETAKILNEPIRNIRALANRMLNNKNKTSYYSEEDVKCFNKIDIKNTKGCAKGIIYVDSRWIDRQIKYKNMIKNSEKYVDINANIKNRNNKNYTNNPLIKDFGIGKKIIEKKYFDNYKNTLTMAKCGEMIGVSRERIRQLCEANKIKTTNVTNYTGTKHKMIKEKDFIDFVMSNNMTITQKEAGCILGISRDAVYRLCRDNKLKTINVNVNGKICKKILKNSLKNSI